VTLRFERLALLALFLIFTWFTWRGLTMFYSGDDMMNMYLAWNVNPWKLGKSLLMIWIPLYRPLGGVIYRIFYAAFGFHPEPLYIFCWTLLAANVVLAWKFFRSLSTTPTEALIALSLILVHGSFQDLYTSAGTVYDRLCFLFTVSGLIVYARAGKKPIAFLTLLAILALDSKESGVALPVLILCYELLWGTGGFASPRKRWLFGILAGLSVVFVFLRVRRTPDLVATAAYHPKLSITLWMTRVSEYFSILSYHHLNFTIVTTATILVIMATAGLLLRNRPMIFGWLFFVITITPVALIASRPGYVLYVPDVGLGLYFAAAIAGIARLLPHAEIPAFLLVTVLLTWFHAHNWPAPVDKRFSPEYRLTERFRRDFPALPHGSKLLFVSDEFPKLAFDLVFNLRLLYRDRTIAADRLEGPPDQQPDPRHPVRYDHIFASDGGLYSELDPENPTESIRLHILRDYTVGRMMDISRKDHVGYVVSGVMDGDGPGAGRWTEPRAKLKFEVYPASASFTAKFWVPDFVARPTGRKLSILVNGKQAGSVALTKDGMNEIAFPVPRDWITPSGYTIVEMNVDNPYKQFGVVLLKAGFTYCEPAASACPDNETRRVPNH
jgi:hypothetical protein